MSAVMQLIMDAYHISDQQSEMLSNYSDAALEYAVKELSKKKGGVNAPVNWIASVARSFEAKSNRAKTGRGKGFNNPFAAKIVEGKFNANHSPSINEQKMTNDERIEFLSKEISSFKEKIANPQNYFLPNVDIDAALAVGNSLLAKLEQELYELINPKSIIIDPNETAMTPEQWLLWNKKRKMGCL